MRVLWVQARDARGRLFHRRTEYDAKGGLWAVLDGVWVGVHAADGIVPVRVDSHPLGDTESPTFEAVDDKWFSVGDGELLLPVGCRWRGFDFQAALARHPGTRCDQCGDQRGQFGWCIDARTVNERVLCGACRYALNVRIHAERPRYQEVDCACGAWCYVQVEPKPDARGTYHDVLPCPKCKALCCAGCLPEGAKSCAACKAKRKAA